MVEKETHGEASMPGAAASLPTQPYPGIRSFRRTAEEDEALIFFGRENQIYTVVDYLRLHHFAAVLGPSGCGKSSLVKVGVLPKLDEGYLLAAGRRWRSVVMEPGGNPLRALSQSLQELYPEAQISEDLVQSEPSFLIRLAREAQDDANRILVVDQFEELFLPDMKMPAEQITHFINLLLHVFYRKPDNFYVILTMRTDYLQNCALFKGLAEALNTAQFLTPRLNRVEMEYAIRKPVETHPDYRATLEQELVVELTDVMDAADDYEADLLPLVQHSLQALWHNAPAEEKKLLTRKQLLTLSKAAPGTAISINVLRNCLSEQADEIYETLGPRQQRIAGAMCCLLRQRDALGQETRRRTTLEEIAKLTGEDEDMIREVAEAFMGSKSYLRWVDDGASIDVSHEAFLRNWHTLREILSKEEANAKEFRELLSATRSWLERKGSLLGDPGLTLKHRWWKETRPSPEWASRYLEENRDDSNEPQRTLDQIAKYLWRSIARKYVFYFLMAIAALLAFGFSVVSGHLSDTLKTTEISDRRNLSERLAMQAINLGESKGISTPSTLLLAVESVRATRDAGEPTSSISVSAITSRLRATHRSMRVASPRLKVDFEEISPPLSWMLALRRTGPSPRAGARINKWKKPIPGDRTYLSAGREPTKIPQSFNANGTWLVVGGVDGTLYAYNTQRQAVVTSRPHTDQVSAVKFVENGQAVLSGSLDGTVALWRLTEPQVAPKVLLEAGGPVTDLRTLPDGDTALAVASTSTVLIRLKDGFQQHILDGPKTPISDLVVASSGDFIAASERARNVVWLYRKSNEAAKYDRQELDLARISPEFDYGSRVGIVAIEFSEANGLLVIVTTRGAAIVDVRDKIPELVHQRPVLDLFASATASPDGRWVALGGNDHVYMVDFERPGNITRLLRSVDGATTSLRFSSDGKFLLVGSYRVTIFELLDNDWEILWGLRAPTFVTDIAVGEESLVMATLDGPRMYTKPSEEPGDQGRPNEFSFQQYVPLAGFDTWVTSLALSPDGKLLASASQDGMSRIWDLNAIGEKVFPRQLFNLSIENGDAFRMSPSRAWIALQKGRRDESEVDLSTVDLWRVSRPDAPFPKMEKMQLGRASGAVVAMSINPSESELVTVSDRNVLEVWKLPGESDELPSSSKPIVTLDTPAPPPSSRPAGFFFSTDGKWLMLSWRSPTQDLTQVWRREASDSFALYDTIDGRVLRVDVESGRIAATSRSVDVLLRFYALTDSGVVPDGEYPTSALDLGTAGDRVDTLLISPKGDALVVTTLQDKIIGHRIVEASDAADGIESMKFEQTLRVDYDQPIKEVDLDPSGQYLAVTDWDGQIDLWHLPTGRHKSAQLPVTVTDLFFSREGDWLAASSASTVYIWSTGDDGTYGQKPVPLDVENTVVRVEFGSGKWFLVQHLGGIDLWSYEIGTLLRLACDAAGRQMTDMEWQDYMGQKSYRATCGE